MNGEKKKLGLINCTEIHGNKKNLADLWLTEGERVWRFWRLRNLGMQYEIIENNYCILCERNRLIEFVQNLFQFEAQTCHMHRDRSQEQSSGHCVFCMRLDDQNI